MTRLPINLLLYVCSAGLAAGSAWTFYSAMTSTAGLSLEEISSESSAHIRKGREETPSDQRDRYSGDARAWWNSFDEANLVGLEIKPPEAMEEKPVEPEKTVTAVPVQEILDVVGLAFDSNNPGWCVVRYKPMADVRPPKTVAGEGEVAGGSVPGYAGPADSVRPANPGRAVGSRGNARGVPAGRPGMPAFAGGEQRVFQILREGESLWPTYDDIKLLRVQADGQAVFFTRTVPGQAEPMEEKMIPSELGLSQEVLAVLAKDAGSRTSSGRSTGREPAQGASSDWIDVPETRAVSPGQWHISKADDRYLRDNAQTVFNEEFSARSYTSRSGSVRGVQVTRISPRLERFGVQSGDVVLELNGVKVSTKAQALREGRRMYKQGVRTFRAKILTGLGRIEERTYHAPNN